MRRTGWVFLTLTAMLAIACSSDGTTPPVPPVTDPGGTPEANLQFLRPVAGAALTRDSLSFWAVKGQNREVTMYAIHACAFRSRRRRRPRSRRKFPSWSGGRSRRR